MSPLTRLFLGAVILLPPACGGDDAGTDLAQESEVFPPDGCFSFTALPDSAYRVAEDVDWPPVVRWRDRRGEFDEPYRFTAEALNPDWRSLASPIGRGRVVPPDSLVFDWGHSYRLRVTENGDLSGLALMPAYGDSPGEVVGEVTGRRVACPDSMG